MTLDKLKPGEDAYILRVDGNDLPLRKHMLDMGLTPGTEVTMVKAAPMGAVSFLVFCLLYTPCVAAIASVKRELGTKWAAGLCITQCAVAWVISFLVYTAGCLLF